MKASLWKLQIIPLHHKTLVTGILIKGSPKVQSEKDKRFSTLKKVLGTYLHKPLKKVSLCLQYKDLYCEVISGMNGEFKAELNGKVSEDISIHLKDDPQELTLLQNYPVRFNSMDEKYFVITDIDDTILQSYAKNYIKKLSRLLFLPPVKRKRIEASHEAFSHLSAHHFQFFYLSRSEYNLFHLITTFLIENKFPLGPIFLRRFTRWKKLLHKNNRKHFKYQVLDEIFEDHKTNKILFFGDDSQYDLDIYTHFESKFPNSVLGIFIHRTKGRHRKKETEWKNNIQNQLKNVHFYSSFEEVLTPLNLILDEITIRS